MSLRSSQTMNRAGAREPRQEREGRDTAGAVVRPLLVVDPQPRKCQRLEPGERLKKMALSTSVR